VTGILRASTRRSTAPDTGSGPAAGPGPGTRIDDVTIAYRIAHGMSADVFAVWHHGLFTPLVCKRLRPSDQKHVAHRRRLRAEGHVLSLLAHPGIVRLVDQRHGGALPYLLLEHMGKRTLRDLLKADGPFEVAHGVRIVQHVAAAVAHVHARGFLHRDLKPSNVVLRDGRPVLLDFGVAWRLAPRRRPPDRSGTPQYLAPEQITRAVLTPATDVWGLGVMLVELLTGERPFAEGVKLHDAALPARYPQLVAAPRLARALPAELVRVIETCLQKSRRGRLQTAMAVARALDPFTDVKIWPATPAGKFEPFEPAEPLTPLRRFRS
jgi:eukaryotic-like serine/threonine-protein kinase